MQIYADVHSITELTKFQGAAQRAKARRHEACHIAEVIDHSTRGRTAPLPYVDDCAKSDVS